MKYLLTLVFKSEKNMKNLLSAIVFFLILFTGVCDDDEAHTVDAPNARFTFEVDVDDPLTVAITNASLNATSCTWDLGEGNSFTETSPTHTYSAGGSYSVILTASSKGGEDSSIETVVVEDLLGAADLIGDWKVAAEAHTLNLLMLREDYI